MRRFDEMVEHIFDVEGGYVDHKNDKGGATNMGITIGTLSEWRKKPVTKQDVMNLTKVEAKQIYKTMYYDLVGGDKIVSNKVSLVLFDFGVNGGVGTINRIAQKVANAPAINGIMGPQTLQAINKVNEVVMVRELIQGIQRRYIDIVLKDRTQMVFLSGWINRSHELWDRAT